MQRNELEGLTREELIAHAERLGVPRPRVLTQPELIDEIINRTARSERERAKSRGWLGRARDLLAKVMEQGLHLPDAARALRSTSVSRTWPTPPPPLPTVTLAEIYAAQGHLERAISVLGEVLSREPDHKEAQVLRDRFIEQAQKTRVRPARAPETRAEADANTDAATGTSTATAADAATGTTTTADAATGANAATDAGADAAPEANVPSGGADVAAPVESKTEAEPEDTALVAETSARSETAADTGNATEADTQTAATAEIAPEAAAETEAATATEAVPEPAAEAISEAAAETAPEATAETEAATSIETAPEAAPAIETASETAAASEVAASSETKVESETVAESESKAALDLPAAEQADTTQAAAAAPAALDDTEALPDRYEVDEVVAIAVDPETIYLYWEVRPVTLARAQAKRPAGVLALRIIAVTPSWDGPITKAWDIPLETLYGDRFLRDIPPGANVRVSVGWLNEGAFEPFAVGLEVMSPRDLPAESHATATGHWSPDATPPRASRRTLGLPGQGGQGAPPHGRISATNDRIPHGRITSHGQAQAGGAAGSGLAAEGASAGRGAAHQGGSPSWMDASAARAASPSFSRGGASDLWRGGASDLSRGGASELWRSGYGMRGPARIG